MTNLLDLTTEHPGGWADILAALGNHAGETVPTIDLRNKRTVVNTDFGDIAAKISKIAPAVSGLLANDAHSELRRAHLPVPSDPDWLQPAEKWFEKAA